VSVETERKGADMKSMKWVVGALLLVAVLLLLNLLKPAGPNILVGEALAQNRATTGGDYVVAAGRTTSSAQVLYVADTRLKRLVVYGNKPGGPGLTLLDTQDLNRAFPKGCSGQIVLQPFMIQDRAEGVAVIDVVNKKLVSFVSYNYGRLTAVGTADLAVDLGS